MIRVLVLIAVTGFLVSVVTLSVAVGIGGPEAIARSAWSWHSDGPWRFGHGSWLDDEDRQGHGQSSREIAWTGGDSLSVDVPAEITYTQVAGAAGLLRVSGSKRAVDDLEIVDGHIRFKSGRGHRHSRLEIAMTSPSVNRFTVAGSGDLTIRDYRQDKLTLNLSGKAEVEVAGEAKSLDLQISGSGDTDLSDLKLQEAKVDIAGSGQATLAPTSSAALNISGSGEITLLTRPAKLESDITGSGQIHQAERAMPGAAEETVRPGQT